MLGAAKRSSINPHYFIVLEDAASIAIGLERNTEGGESDALAEAAKRNAEIAFFAAEVRQPAMIISLQKRASSHQRISTPSRSLRASSLRQSGAWRRRP